MEVFEETRKQFVTVVLRMNRPAEVARVKDALQQYSDHYKLASGDQLRRAGEHLQRIYDGYEEGDKE